MKAARDQGYILASVLGVLLAISIVAAALVGSSGEALLRIKRAEQSVQSDTLLESALAAVVNQLLLDPRRRSIDLDRVQSLQVMGRSVRFRISWENGKIDVNTANLDAIGDHLTTMGVRAALRSRAEGEIARKRSAGETVTLLGGLGLDRSEESCLASFLTVFGGQTSSTNVGATAEPSRIGRPAAGSRVAIDLAIEGEASQGLSTVVLLTGSAERPWEILDWRRSSALAEGVCDEA